VLVRREGWHLNLEKDHLVDLHFFLLETDHECLRLEGIVQDLWRRPLMIVSIFHLVNRHVLTLSLQVVVRLGIINLKNTKT
jgi:hypothetical protein